MLCHAIDSAKVQRPLWILKQDHCGCLYFGVKCESLNTENHILLVANAYRPQLHVLIVVLGVPAVVIEEVDTTFCPSFTALTEPRIVGV